MAPSRCCTDDIVGRGSWCEFWKLNCKSGRWCFAVHLRAAVLHSGNQSHFTDLTIELAKENFAPPASPIAIGGNKPTSRAFVAGFEAHWGAADLQNHLNHPAPAVQLFTVLRGQFSITVTDGETRQLHAGDMALLEDIAPCRGHITVVGDEPGFLLFAR